MVKTNWTGVNTTWGVGAREGGVRYHIGRSIINPRRFNISMKGVHTDPHGENRK